MSEIQLVVIGIPGEDGYLDAMGDFPHVIEPGADFGMTLGEVQSEPWWNGSKTKRMVGRDQNENPLWVDASNLPLKVQSVTTPGIVSRGGVRYLGNSYDINYRPPSGAVPYVGIQGCVAYNLSVASQLNTGSYRVLAAWTEDPEEAPPQIEGWGPLDSISEARWTSIRNPLVTLGIDAAVIDNWRSVNPSGTPVQFINALKSYLNSQ